MLLSLLYGLAAGLGGTIIGGIIACIVKKDSAKLTALLLSFASGIMLSVVCFDLIPISVKLSNIWLTLGATVLGAVVIMAGQGYVEYRLKSSNRQFNPMRNSGLIIMFAIGLHNLPEGLIIGAGEVVSQGVVMAVLIGLHDVPEGLAMALPLRCSGERWHKVLAYCAVTGLPTALGAAVGFAFGSVSPLCIALCSAAAGGAMMYIVYAELIPEANKIGGGAGVSLAGVIGVVVGLLMVFCI